MTVQPHWFKAGRDVQSESATVYFDALLWNVLQEACTNYENPQCGQHVAVIQHRWSVTCVSPWRPGFAPRSVHVGFVVNKVAMGKEKFQDLHISSVNIILPIPHIHSCII
jgi:hypothetical protein